MSIQLFRPIYEVEGCMDRIRAVLESGWTGQGPNCVEFEKKWGEYVGNPCSHFVSSATAALHIAVRLLDLPEGSIIATTPLTFVSTNAVILYERHVPVFCDCGKDLSLSFESVKEAIEKKGAKAVIWVHYGGSISDDFYNLMSYVKECRPDVKVIEDCAHASGACYQYGAVVGSRKDTISCFSFHSVKNLPIFDGGMICVPDQEKLARAKRLSWLGIDKSTYARTVGSEKEIYKWSYNVSELGWKYNGNDIAASIGLTQLELLDLDNDERERLYSEYIKRLGEECVMEHSEGSSHHLFVVFTDKRDELISRLKEKGIAPGVHYLPNYKFPPFSSFSRDCPMVESFCDHIISLPNHLDLNNDDLDMIAMIVKPHIMD